MHKILLLLLTSYFVITITTFFIPLWAKLILLFVVITLNTYVMYKKD